MNVLFRTSISGGLSLHEDYMNVLFRTSISGGLSLHEDYRMYCLEQILVVDLVYMRIIECIV